MNSFERAVDYAEYLVELGRQNPAVLAATSQSTSVKSKSIHQKLLDLYIEETGKQSDEKKLQCNTHLLKKLVRREKLNCLILNLYPGNDGYSLMLRSKTGVETETVKLPYEVTELLEYVDDSELPPFLVDVLEKAQVNVFYNGCVIVEIRDFRRSTIGTFDIQYVLLRPNPQTLLCDINNLTNDGHVWTQEDLFHLESKLLLATEEPLCLDPSPAVLLVANRQQYDRKKLNTPLLKRSVKKYSQAAVNRKRKFAQSPAPRELQLHDFVNRKKEKASTSSIPKQGKSSVDFWKQKPVTLSCPESVDVEKYAKVLDKPEKSSIKDNTLSLVEEHVLERDGMLDKKLLAKLTIYHRPGDDAHIGELYLDHDYVENKSKGATCRFLLGNKDSVRKYLDQFREIFTEEGRRAVKITTHRPGQAPVVTCTQTTPTNLPAATASINMAATKVISSITTQPTDVLPASSIAVGNMKRPLPIQLALSIGLSVAGTPPALLTQQGAPVQAVANQAQLNMQASVQAAQATQRLSQQQQQQAAGQSQSASQRLKQLGIHTSIASRNNTPTASPVGAQPTIAQLFGTVANNSVCNTPTLHTVAAGPPSHTPTPPPPIISPPPQQQGGVAGAAMSRKSSLTLESSTIHHMAQTSHQANVATFVQGEGSSITPVSSTATNVGHQQPGMANINIANITGIPPNVNIQNLTGLPGMNIANLQVSLSVPGGSIAVPISMISTNPVLHNQAGLVATSTAGMAPSTSHTGLSSTVQPGQSSIVTMVTQQPVTSAISTVSPSASVTGVLSQASNVIPGTGMLSVPINLGCVPTALKSAGQIRGASSMPVQLQIGQQGIQLVNLPQQRATLKPGTSLQAAQALGPMGVKPSTSIQGPLTTAILSNPNLGQGQPVLSHLPVKSGQAGGITTTLTHQQLLQLQPQFQALQAFQKPVTPSQKPQQQQLQFHEILKHPVIPTQPGISFGGKPAKTKKRTTPTPPK